MTRTAGHPHRAMSRGGRRQQGRREEEVGEGRRVTRDLRHSGMMPATISWGEGESRGMSEKHDDRKYIFFDRMSMGMRGGGGVRVCLLVACLTSQQQASASQGRICSDNLTCCHTEIQVADQTFYLTQSQYTDTGPTSPSADPITPGAWQVSHWSANV